MTAMWLQYSLHQTTATAVETRRPSWNSMTPSNTPSFSLTQLPGVGSPTLLGRLQTTSCRAAIRCQNCPPTPCGHWTSVLDYSRNINILSDPPDIILPRPSPIRTCHTHLQTGIS